VGTQYGRLCGTSTGPCGKGKRAEAGAKPAVAGVTNPSIARVIVVVVARVMRRRPAAGPWRAVAIASLPVILEILKGSTVPTV